MAHLVVVLKEIRQLRPKYGDLEQHSLSFFSLSIVGHFKNFSPFVVMVHILGIHMKIIACHNLFNLSCQKIPQIIWSTSFEVLHYKQRCSLKNVKIQ